MKTQKQNKLDFTKNSVVELNNSQMQEINGGGFTLDTIDIIVIMTRGITSSIV